MIVYTGTTVKTYFYLTDHQGTVNAVADENGAIVESYRLDAFGRVMGIYNADNAPLTESAIGNRLLWQGKPYSFRTGFYDNRLRWYDPITGRWLSNDPIGISGGLNQYQAFLSNPVNFTDPDGLAVGGFNKFREKVGGVTAIGPFDAYSASGKGSIGKLAITLAYQFAEAQARYDNESCNDYSARKGQIRNAMRHVYWQALLTQEFGAGKARRIGNLHELGEETTLDSRADQYHNVLGRALGESAGGLGDIIRGGRNLYNSGQLITDYGDSRLPGADDTSYHLREQQPGPGDAADPTRYY